MPRLTPVPWKKLKCVFEKAGFVEGRVKGDHVIMEKPNVERPIVIYSQKEGFGRRYNNKQLENGENEQGRIF